MHLKLLYRYHLVPARALLFDALRQKPVVWLVAGFLVATLVWQTAVGRPVVALPSDRWGASVGFLGLCTLVATVFTLPLLTGRHRWQRFFSVQPSGPRAWFFFTAARALVSWVGAALVVVMLCGPALWGWSLMGVLPFTGAMLALASAPMSQAQTLGLGGRLPGVGAWWLSQPGLYLVPPLAWAGILGWAVTGQAGFDWGDHPPVAALLIDFGWPLLVGLFWSEAGSQIPMKYFRMARAPFRRVLVVVGLPLAVATLVAATAAALWAEPGWAAVRAVLLTVTGSALFVGYWLRWPGASLPRLLVFFALLAAGVAAQKDWWLPWSLAQALVATVVWSGWRTQYYEGESHA